MDTIIFGLLLLSGGVALNGRRRWLVLSSWLLCVALVALLLNHYVALGQAGTQ